VLHLSESFMVLRGWNGGLLPEEEELYRRLLVSFQRLHIDIAVFSGDRAPGLGTRSGP